MSKELRPCPFCGGEAEVFIFPDSPIAFVFVARCKCCDVALHKYISPDTCYSLEEAEQKAVECWNRRAYDAEVSDPKIGEFKLTSNWEHWSEWLDAKNNKEENND